MVAYILIVDFGSQYTQLIARRIRALGVYTELVPFDQAIRTVTNADVKPAALILSGGPRAINDPEAPNVDVHRLRAMCSPKDPKSVPVLGICYGFYVLMKAFGGVVEDSGGREYGRTRLVIPTHLGATPSTVGAPARRARVATPTRVGFAGHRLFNGLPTMTPTVWMSHGNSVTTLPPNFNKLSQGRLVAAAQHDTQPLIGVQFHPEVSHTDYGTRMLKNFVFGVAGLKATWSMRDFIPTAVQRIRTQVGTHQVLLGLSGGVDSTVTAALLLRALPTDQVTCVFVDNGLLRQNETKEVLAQYETLTKGTLIHVDASDTFLAALKGATDPETKRRVIGRVFLDVFRNAAAQANKQFDFLAQGTLYPDVIESVAPHGAPSDTIKSHHNRVAEVLQLVKAGKVIEPLRELFKDDVRALGAALGLSNALVQRQPFPGPGLAIRIVGEVTPERLRMVREADAIVRAVCQTDQQVWSSLWQVFAVFLPIRSVGVMGDKRTYQHTIAVRAVHSEDGMTATWAALPDALLRTLATRIVNEVAGINRVVYDITSKPPGTIEWE